MNTFLPTKRRTSSSKKTFSTSFLKMAYGSIFALLLLMSCGVFGQTNPAAQSLPYTQNFSTLTGSTTTYPAGWQGWKVANPSEAYPVTIGTADKNLDGGANNITSGANILDFNQKMGFMSTSSSGSAIVLAINTTAKNSVLVSYLIGTQRQSTSERKGAVDLQYRVGTSGDFSNLNLEYQNNKLSTSITNATTVSYTTTKSITLPVEAENKSIVQLRWVYREVDGGGNRPSFSIDDISVTGTSSTSVTISAEDYNGTATNWNANTTSNIFYYAALTPNGGAGVLNSVTANMTGSYLAADIPTNGFKLYYSSDFTFVPGGDTLLGSVSSAKSGATENIVWSGLSQSIASGVTGYIYAVADIAVAATNGRTVAGSFTANTNIVFNPAVSYNAGNTYGGTVNKTIVSTSPYYSIENSANLNFGNTCINTNAGTNGSFDFYGFNLTGNVTIGPLAGFSFSKDGTTFTSSLVLPPSGGSIAEAIKVRFSPTAVQSYNGNVSISGGGATATSVAVVGSGISGTVAVTTVAATGITLTGATSGGSSVSTTCGTITAKGVVWNTAINPTVALSSKTTDGTGTAPFSSTLTGLVSSTLYYYRAYVTNNNGITSYGTEMSFTTPCATISTFPYTEGFNGTSLPSCYAATEGTPGASQHWESVADDGSNGVGTAKEGSRFLRMNYFSATTAYNSYDLTSVGFTLPAVQAMQARFSIWMGANSGVSNLQFQISVNGGAYTTLATYGANASNTTSTAPWEEKEVDLSTYVNQVVTFRLKATSNYGTGKCNIGFDDFNIENVPTCRFPVAPFSSAMVAKDNVTISWTAPTTAPANGYEYYLSTTNTAPLSGTTATGSVGAGTITASITTGLVAENTYYWWVRSNCGAGDKSVWVSGGSFFYGYCKPSSTANNNYISNFSTTKGYTTNISNLTSGYTSGGYQDNFATQKVEMYPTGTIDFAFTTPGGSAGLAVWVDWNKDLVFDASERVYSSGGSYSASGTGSITVPNGTAIGDYRMRVRTMNSSYGDVVNPCSFQSTRSEAEDYKLSVVATPNYVVYTDALAANATANNTIDVYLKDFDGVNEFYTNDQTSIWMYTWNYTSTLDINNTSSLVEFIRISTNPNVYKASIKFANLLCIPTGTTVTGIDMLFRNQYGVGGNNQTGDLYLDLTDATVVVNTPTIGSATDITTTTASINWTGPTNGAARGFDYYYSTSNTAPTGATVPSGSVATGVATATLTSLTTATTYYFWVRTKGCDTNSSWSAQGTFVTACTTTALPLTQGFNSTAMPNCWAKSIVDLQTLSKITFVTSGSNPTTSVSEGTHFIKYDSFSATGGGTGSEERLISPPLSSTGINDVNVDFLWSHDNGYSAKNDYVQIEYSTDGVTFTPISGALYARYDAVFNNWNQKKLIISTTLANLPLFYIAFKFHSERGNNMYMDDVKIYATPPTLYANNGTTASLDFGNQNVTTSSVAQSFNLSGISLTGAPNVITVTAPDANFEVSNNNSSWGSSATIAYSATTLVATPVYVRFTPQSGCSALNGNLTLSGGGVSVFPTVSLSGNSVLPAPTANEVTTFTTSGFTANWDAVAGATAYELDVYEMTVGAITLTEGFETGLPTSYGSATNTALNSGQWNLTNIMRTNTFNNGSYGAQMKASTEGVLITPQLSSVESLSFYAKRNGSSGSVPLQVFKIVDGVETPISTIELQNVTTFQNFNIPINELASDNVKIKFRNNASNVINLDDVSIQYNDITKSYVLQNQNVGNVTSYNVTGLTTGKTYYYVVRAISGSCETLDSNEIDFEIPSVVVWTTSNVWNNTVGPTINDDTRIEGQLIVTATENIETKSLTIALGGKITVEQDGTVTTSDAMSNNNVDDLQTALVDEESSAFTIENGGSLVQTPAFVGQNTGKIKMERITQPMNKFDYTYWSSPVAGNMLNALSPDTHPNRYYSYNPDPVAPALNWTVITGGNASMDVGKGYIIRAPNNYPTDSYTAYSGNFKGVPNNGMLSIAVIGADDPAEKYNLLGNPYPSAISADDFISENVGIGKPLAGTLYFWTHNSSFASTGYAYSTADYASWNGLGSTSTFQIPGEVDVNNSPLGMIAAGQGFFVKGIANGFAVFKNSMREAGQNMQFYKGVANAETTPIEKNRVWLNLSGANNAFSQTLVGYVTDATNDYDIRYDGESFGGNSVTFYSVNSAKNLVIQGRALPFVDTDEVTMGYKTTLTGNLTIGIDHVDGLFDNQLVYLKDNVLNVVHNLSTSAYTFAAVPGTFNDRFVLRYLPAEDLANPTFEEQISNVTIRKNDTTLRVNSPYETIDEILIYDIMGRLLFDKKDCNTNTFETNTILNSEQTLIVKVRLTNGGVVTKKVL